MNAMHITSDNVAAALSHYWHIADGSEKLFVGKAIPTWSRIIGHLTALLDVSYHAHLCNEGMRDDLRTLYVVATARLARLEALD